MLLLILFSLVLAYISWTLVRLVSNYVEARKIGLPILICPVNPAGPLWMLSKDVLSPLLVRLPLGLGEWAGRAEVGWTFKEKFAVHAKYGEAFVIVSPGENDLVLANPSATEDVMRRRNDFIKNPAMYGMLDIYGPNLDTVNGKAWDRHRKITVPPFNEQNSALVWRESGEQAEQVLSTWISQGRVTSTQPDVHAVALNVLCGAGFGVHSSFVDTKLPENSEHLDKEHLGYRESLRLLLANIVPLVILGLLKRSGVPNWIWLGSMRRLSIAYDEFKSYMAEMLAREKTAFAQGDFSRHNLMSELVRALEQSKQAVHGDKDMAAAPGLARAGLTDDEVYGNLFIYNLAGHDTTASTLHFAITLLAIYPEWQAWVAEEIDQVREAESTGLYYYEQTFPKLQRCLALMYETLRLYGPVVMMPRYTGDSAQRLRINDKECVIPPKTGVVLNFAALHTHPDYWGSDPLAFRPDRWIVPADDKGEGEALSQPAVPGTYVPWNLGPRACPGRKFSQVEFTRLIFGLFGGGTRVELVKEEAESDEEAKTRALSVVNGAKLEVTLKMSGAERVPLRWTKPA